MLKKKLTLISFLLLATVYLFGQENRTIESIRKSTVTETDEKKLTWDYYNLAKLFVQTNFDSAGIYYQKALSLALKQENKKLTAEIYINISKLQSKKSEFTEAEKNCLNAIDLSNEIRNDTLKIISNLTLAKIKISANNYTGVIPILESTLQTANQIEDSLLISDCYDAFGLYYFYSDASKSADYYIKSLRILEKFSDSEDLLTRYINIGSLFGRLTQNNKAIEYLTKGAEIAKETNQEYVMSNIYNNLAVIYFEMKDVSKSRHYLEEALKIAQNQKDDAMVCGIVVNLGELYQGEKQYKTAMEYYQQGLNNPAIKNMPDQEIYTLHNIATLYYDLMEYQTAIKFGEEALLIAKNQNISMHNVELYKVLAESYEKNNNYKPALEYQKRYKAANDSLFNMQSTEKIAEIHSKYELDKASNENILLKKDNSIQALTIETQKNQQLLLLLLLSLILIIVVFIFYRMRKDRKMNALLQLKNEEIRLKSIELEEANLAKDKFFSILAHDLRNPFNSILGSLEILHDQYYKLDDNERLQFIKLMHKSAHSTDRLLSNLLEWSIAQRDGIILEKKENNISEIISESVNIHHNIAQKKEITIDNHISENTWAYFDKKTISIAINNILNNALKFTPKNGSISVFSQSKDGTIDISIKDTGIGMSPQILNSLFRIDTTQSRQGTDSEKGTGLGLILCKEFVEQNNGKLSVTSKKGEGCCFVITLPAKAQHL